MKTNLILAAASAVALTSAAFAGDVMYTSNKKTVTPLTPVYGVGWYGGLQLGINAYQDFGGTRRFSLGNNDISLEPKEKIGFVGGVKVGYVFGTGAIRPAVEADLYYNGVEADLDARVNGRDTNANADANLHSGAFMGNFLLRFNCLNQFQPYFGAGLGGYYAESQNVEVKVGNRTFHGDGGSNSGFAWQLIGGSDYYWTEKVSTFLEYKFLNYEDAGINSDRISQHLVVLGVRWHF